MGSAWVSKQSRDKMFVSFFLEEKEKNRDRNWFCHFIHFCAISPHITAAEDQAGAAAWAFCCVSGLAANHAHTIAAIATIWERSSSSEVGRRALYWPLWRSAEIFFFVCFCKLSVAPLPNSSPSLQPFMILPRATVAPRWGWSGMGGGGWRDEEDVNKSRKWMMYGGFRHLFFLAKK